MPPVMLTYFQLKNAKNNLIFPEKGEETWFRYI